MCVCAHDIIGYPLGLDACIIASTIVNLATTEIKVWAETTTERGEHAQGSWSSRISADMITNCTFSHTHTHTLNLEFGHQWLMMPSH